MSDNKSIMRNIFYSYYGNLGNSELPEVSEADTELDKYIQNIGLDTQQIEKLHDLIMDLVCANEKQGFYYGFSAGLNLSNEVNQLNNKTREVTSL